MLCLWRIPASRSFMQMPPRCLTCMLGTHSFPGGGGMQLMLLFLPLQRERLSRGFTESVLMAGDPNNNEKFTNRIK